MPRSGMTRRAITSGRLDVWTSGRRDVGTAGPRNAGTSGLLIVLMFLTVPARAMGQSSAPPPTPLDWHSLATPNLTIVGGAPEGTLRRVGFVLRRFRDAVAPVLPAATHPPGKPTTVIVFPRREQMAPFATRVSQGPYYEAGLFLGGMTSNYILMTTADDDFDVAYHEVRAPHRAPAPRTRPRVVPRRAGGVLPDLLRRCRRPRVHRQRAGAPHRPASTAGPDAACDAARGGLRLVAVQGARHGLGLLRAVVAPGALPHARGPGTQDRRLHDLRRAAHRGRGARARQSGRLQARARRTRRRVEAVSRARRVSSATAADASASGRLRRVADAPRDRGRRAHGAGRSPVDHGQVRRRAGGVHGGAARPTRRFPARMPAMGKCWRSRGGTTRHARISPLRPGRRMPAGRRS